MTRHQTAFTLSELLICLTLISIFASLSLPLFLQFIRDNRDTTTRNQLLSFLQAARVQAVLQKQARSVCGSSDGTSCTGHWDQNWLIVSHSNEPLQRLQLPSDSTLCWRGFSDNIKFHINGTTPTSNGRFALCRNGSATWTMVLNRQGRVRYSPSDNSANCCDTNHPST